MEALKKFDSNNFTVLLESGLLIRRQIKLQLAIYQKIFNPNLKGACGLATMTLFNKFKSKYDLNAIFGLYKKQYHCWIDYNNLIIDLTATQFNIKKEIYIAKYNHKYKAIAKIINAKFFNSWNSFANPSNYLVTWKDNVPIFKYKY